MLVPGLEEEEGLAFDEFLTDGGSGDGRTTVRRYLMPLSCTRPSKWSFSLGICYHSSKKKVSCHF